MPVKLLNPKNVDVAEETLELLLAEQQAEMGRFKPSAPTDLSDGGTINGVTLTPMKDGQKLTQGRDNGRRAWMWNGTESVIPLAWNPEGTTHDGGLKYLRKRHCLCCSAGGFRGNRCPACTKNNCQNCAAGLSKKPNMLGNGNPNSGYIIPNFYLKQEDVPFPTKFYGSFDCFLPTCIRTASQGFKTQEDMRMHARSRHKMEYQAHLETLNSSRSDELADLKQQLSDLKTAMATNR